MDRDTFPIREDGEVELRGERFTLVCDGVLHADHDPDAADAAFLTLSLISQRSGRTWRGAFPGRVLEAITRKTGNFKRFPVFVEMLLCTLSERHNANVRLGLLTQDDLLRHGPSEPGDMDRMAAVPVHDWAAHPRLYLILVYAAAFDRVYYPLPLTLQPLRAAPSSRPHRPPSVAVDGPAWAAMDVAQLREELATLQAERQHHLDEIARLWKENDLLKHRLEQPAPPAPVPPSHAAARADSTQARAPWPPAAAAASQPAPGDHDPIAMAGELLRLIQQRYPDARLPAGANARGRPPARGTASTRLASPTPQPSLPSTPPPNAPPPLESLDQLDELRHSLNTLFAYLGGGRAATAASPSPARLRAGARSQTPPPPPPPARASLMRGAAAPRLAASLQGGSLPPRGRTAVPGTRVLAGGAAPDPRGRSPARSVRAASPAAHAGGPRGPGYGATAVGPASRAASPARGAPPPPPPPPRQASPSPSPFRRFDPTAYVRARDAQREQRRRSGGAAGSRLSWSASAGAGARGRSASVSSAGASRTASADPPLARRRPQTPPPPPPRYPPDSPRRASGALLRDRPGAPGPPSRWPRSVQAYPPSEEGSSGAPRGSAGPARRDARALAMGEQARDPPMDTQSELGEIDARLETLKQYLTSIHAM